MSVYIKGTATDLCILPTGNCSPALAERDTALAFTLASLPALPPAWVVVVGGGGGGGGSNEF